MVLGFARQKHDLVLLASLFLLELSVAVIAMAMYMKGERPFFLFLSSKPGMVFVMMVGAALIAIVLLMVQYQANTRSQSSHFRLIVTMNIVTVMLILITGEMATRMLSRSSIEGEKLGGAVLLPKSWRALTLHNQQLLNKAAGHPTFHVYDDVLGWTVGPNRQSADGLYYSSFEGIRAPHEGLSFAKPTKKTRIALVGDSYTFGEDVVYENTWGHFLEKALGPEFEVLNFGVPGYGLDQAYLRYEKDVQEWKPKIVILSFIAHDIERTMTVYTSLNYPAWDMPFSKPRFLVKNGDLKRLNIPPLKPEAIFSRGSISSLPFLDYDRGYRERDWQQNVLHSSYLARAFFTWLPRWQVVSPDVTEEALTSVNAAILKAFVASTERIAAIPLVVYHPKRALDAVPNSSLSRRVLQESGVSYSEPTSCLQELNPDDWFISQGHYTPEGNAAVAKCLVNVVRQTLGQSPVSQG